MRIHPGRVLLLACALLTTGCASLTPPPGRGMSLRHTPPVAEAPGLAPEERPRALASAPPSTPGPEQSQPLHRRRGPRGAGTGVNLARKGEVDGDAVAAGAAQPGSSAIGQAALGALADVSGSAARIDSVLSRLAAPGSALREQAGGLFFRYVEYGNQQLRWIDGALGEVVTLTRVASQVEDPEMELALLRMSGPRLQAALLGTLLLAAWADLLQLADAVLQPGPGYSVEKLLASAHGMRQKMEPSLTALSSLESARLEDTAHALPWLMDEFTLEFEATHAEARRVLENREDMVALLQLVEVLRTGFILRPLMPRLPPAAPLTLGVGLVGGSGGVMMGTRVVVSAEWVERMRRLVQAGVISLPAVSAAVRIHAGGMMMAQGPQELPPGVREALGDGPEVRGMRVTGRAGAGMAESPLHHALPREQRAWFEQRGFTGAMDIDQFCVRLERAKHEAIHGGGDWRLGRMWPGEWNRLIMEALQNAEVKTGRMLTQSEILKLVAREMKRYKLPMNFTPWGGK